MKTFELEEEAVLSDLEYRRRYLSRVFFNVACGLLSPDVGQTLVALSREMDRLGGRVRRQVARRQVDPFPQPRVERLP